MSRERPLDWSGLWPLPCAPCRHAAGAAVHPQRCRARCLRSNAGFVFEFLPLHRQPIVKLVAQIIEAIQQQRPAEHIELRLRINLRAPARRRDQEGIDPDGFGLTRNRSRSVSTTWPKHRPHSARKLVQCLPEAGATLPFGALDPKATG